MELEKLYLVDFMDYTSLTKSTVSRPGDLGGKYIDVSHSPVIIRESDIEFYRQYGDGFRNLKFVGYLYSIKSSDGVVINTVPDFNSDTYESEVRSKLGSITCDSSITLPSYYESPEPQTQYAPDI